jgi:hypothetical protein
MTDVNWSALMKADRRPDKNELLKAATAAVRAPSLWVALEERGGRLVANCPVHSDENPSFDVYQNEGDIFDVIEALDPFVDGFSIALCKAAEILNEYDAGDGWESKPVAPRPWSTATNPMCRSTQLRRTTTL